MVMTPHNKLAHLKEFQKALSNYKPNIEVIDLLNNVKVVLLVAPAASGRNTIIRNMIMTGKYYYLVSDTTRQPRVNNGIPERSGVEYWFRTEVEFLEGLKRGEYIEAAIIHEQQVSGTSIDELRVAREKNLIAITDIDLQGCENIRDFADIDNVFVLPPDFDEWMRRMDTRGAMDPQEKKRRLQSAVREISDAMDKDYFKFLVNWDLRSTIEQLHEEITQSAFDPVRQEAARNHAVTLLARLDSEL
jgi:guanylate kinase